MLKENNISHKLKKIIKAVIGLILVILSFILFWIRPKNARKEDTATILVVKMERIGDMVLSMPAINELKAVFPKSRILLAVNSYISDIAKNDPHIDELLIYDKEKVGKGFPGKIKFIKNLRARNFDLAVDLTTREFYFFPAFIVGLCRAKMKVGLDNNGRGFLFTNKVKPLSKPQYYPNEIMHILSPLGIIAGQVKLKLCLSGNDQKYIDTYLSEREVNNADNLIVIHPGGYYPEQHYRKYDFAKAIDYLIEKYAAKVFLIGAAGEQGLADEIINMTKAKAKPFNAAGIFTLGQSMSLISKAKLFIGNSSGPLHAACALSVPTISFLSPDAAERWRPQGKNDITFDLSKTNLVDVISAIDNLILK
ncbi:MAG: glycosyltransferase family 9 protein [Candidatus Omnitrophota bacterium]